MFIRVALLAPLVGAGLAAPAGTVHAQAADPPAPAEEVCRKVMARLTGVAGEDDIAVLAIHRDG